MAKKILKSLKNKFCRVEHTDRHTHTHSFIYIDEYKSFQTKFVYFMVYKIISNFTTFNLIIKKTKTFPDGINLVIMYLTLKYHSLIE